MKKEDKSFKRFDLVLLSTIILVALLFRFYKINTPLADLHSWRQADTAAVARNFARDGFDLLHPHFDDLSSLQSGIENPQGLRYVEFPLYNAIFSLAYKLYPAIPIEMYGRMTSIFFSLLIIGVIYYLALKEWGRLTAFFAASVFAVFPYFVFFSRVVLPETMATALAMLSIFFLYLSLYHTNQRLSSVIYYLSSLVCFALSLLVKPPVIVYGVALVILFWEKYRFAIVKHWTLYAYFIIAAIPVYLWRRYITFFPQGVPPSDWLLPSVNTSEGLQNIFFKPAFFRWIFFERLNKAILGGYLTFFFILGILIKTRKYILYGVLLSALFYLFIFQGGNIQHEYYQTIIFPAVALFVGRGIALVIENLKLFIHPVAVVVVVVSAIFLSFFFSFYIVKDYYNVPPELPQIARIVNTLTTSEDHVVTDRLGDTTLLYLMDRKGAPAIYKDPPELKKIGYTYLVTLNSEKAQELEKTYNYKIVFANDKFTLFRL